MSKPLPSLADYFFHNKNIPRDLDFSLFDIHATTVFDTNALQYCVWEFKKLKISRAQFEYLLYNSNLNHIDADGFTALHRIMSVYQNNNQRKIITKEDIKFLFEKTSPIHIQDYAEIFNNFRSKVYKIFTTQEIEEILLNVDCKTIFHKYYDPIGVFYSNFLSLVLGSKHLTNQQLKSIIDRSEVDLPKTPITNSCILGPFRKKLSNANFNAIFDRLYTNRNKYDADLLLGKLENFNTVKSKDKPNMPLNLIHKNHIYQWRKIVNYMLNKKTEKQTAFQIIIENINNKPELVQFMFEYIQDKDWFINYIDKINHSNKYNPIYYEHNVRLYREKRHLESTIEINLNEIHKQVNKL